jgi:hypothetical protein
MTDTEAICETRTSLSIEIIDNVQMKQPLLILYYSYKRLGLHL